MSQAEERARAGRDGAGPGRAGEIEEVEPREQPQALQSVANTFALLRDVWRIVRGEDERGRKVRWMLGLLRPYRRQVILMLVALVAATAAGLAPQKTSTEARKTPTMTASAVTSPARMPSSIASPAR